MNGNFYMKHPEKPVAYLVHEPTHSNIAVFKRIGLIRRFMIRLCFGMKYKKI